MLNHILTTLDFRPVHWAMASVWACVGLAPADRTRLAKTCGMLGSNHAGERDAAALAATRFLRERGLTWFDLLVPTAPPPEPAPSSDWRAQAADAARYSGLLTPWERNFLRVLPKFEALSAKQAATLQAIVEKVHAR